MDLTKIGLAFLGLLVLLLAAGCDKAGPEPAAIGSVKANAAFLEHFGEPPVPDQGTCYARVGYLPLAGEPARVRAVPLFLFREGDQPSRLLERLVTGDWEFAPRSGLLNPFPPGSTVRITGQAGDRITIDLLLPATDGAAWDPAIMVAPLVETALQFEEVKSVFITVGGVALAATPADGFRHDPRRIAPAGPPRPIMAVGNWEEGENDPEEVLVNFDRPITIQEFRLTDAAGREIRGEYFRTGFDMSVVVHPAVPGELREGMMLKVAWKVGDRLDRTSSGEETFSLKRHDHEQ